MPTYLVLFRFTEQGIRDVKHTLERERELLKAAERSDLTIRSLHYLQGEYDLVAMVEAPDDKTMKAAEYAVRSRGNVELTYFRAFTEEEMEDVIELLP
jgi:uncharacterized protein with GYD domain